MIDQKVISTTGDIAWSRKSSEPSFILYSCSRAHVCLKLMYGIDAKQSTPPSVIIHIRSLSVLLKISTPTP